ncbi:MAG: cell wall-binding repeat-containing protein [Tissierellia bacterium]|nr:cell wall-binding repeat-containing protein [Tissierellia bacterium]
MKKIIIKFLIILSILLIPYSISMADSGEKIDNISIAWSLDNKLLQESLPKKIEYKDSSGKQYKLEIDWDTSNFIPWEIGTKTIIGYYYNEDGILDGPKAFKINVNVNEPESESLFIIPINLVVDYGSSFEEIEKKLPRTIDVVDNNKRPVYDYRHDISWDISGVDTKKPGVYSLYGEYNLSNELKIKSYDKPKAILNIEVKKPVVESIEIPELKPIVAPISISLEELIKDIEDYILESDVFLIFNNGDKERIKNFNIELLDYEDKKYGDFNISVKVKEDDSYVLSKDFVFLIKGEVLRSNRVQRIFGKDRIETSINVAKTFNKDSKTMVVASARDFPDALVAGPYAQRANASLILTEKMHLSQQIKEYIESNSFKKMEFIGGNNSVSDSVLKEQERYSSIIADRIYGIDRIETSIKLANKYIDEDRALNSFILADAYNFADALSASAIANAYDIPIILFSKDYDYSKLNLGSDINKVYIVGGETRLGTSDIIKSKIIPKNADVLRISGKNRYLTALKVAKFLPNYENLIIASGDTFADSLVAGSITNIIKAPILLVSKDEIEDDTLGFINESEVPIYIIGGPSRISDKLIQKFE